MQHRIMVFGNVCRLVYGVFLLFFFSFQTFGAGYPRLTYLGIEQGLSNNNVTSIYQDRHGFMWFGTYDGLNRYDGYNFKVFRNIIADSNSLVNDRINCIQEGGQDDLWVGTGKGGSVYNSISYQFQTLLYLPYGQKVARKIESSINSIKPDNRGNMFLASKKGLFLTNKLAEPATQIPLLLSGAASFDYEAVVVECDPSDRVWVLVRNVGLCLYDYTGRGLRLVDERVKDNSICLKADKYENIWIGAVDGIYKYSIPTRRLTGKKLNSRVVNLSFDRENSLWVSSDGGGAFTIDSACDKITQILSRQDNESLASTAVFAIYEDKEDRKWIATLRGGITIVDPNKQLFEAVLRNPADKRYTRENFINCFCEDRAQRIWIGTDGSGVSLWDRKANSYSDLRFGAPGSASIHGNAIVNMTGDFQGNVWLAEWLGGFDKYDPSTGRFEHYPCYNTITHAEDRFAWFLYEDAGKGLWAATSNSGGLYLFNRQRKMFELFDNGLKDILIMAEDKAGDLWAGDYGEDLIRVDRASKKHRRWHIGYRVRTIHEDRKGNFWIGTEGGGLLLFDRLKGTYVRYTQANGLPGNSILSMLEDKDGKLWMGTYNGLSKLDPERKSFKNYTISDGLQSNQFNYNTALSLKSGEFIFGGARGSDIFDPSVINQREKEKAAPGLFLTGLKIDNMPLEVNTSFISKQRSGIIEELTIPYSKAVISFDFVALEYSAPDKIDYAYRMDGIDRDWNYIDKRRSASFSRLHEGDYIFRVRSTSADGIWNPRQISVHIVVLPPWYRTWLAYLLYLAMVVTGLYLYFRFVRKRDQLAYEVKLAQLETEKEREMNEKKLSFFTNVTHEFRTPLTLILNPVQEMLKNGPSDGAGENNGLKAVYRNARRLLGLVDQLLLFRKAGSENDNIQVAPFNFALLCREVYGYFTQQAKLKRIDYRFSCDMEEIELYVDREKMEIALFNIVSNAMRYTPEGGMVLFDVRELEAEVVVNISDNGPGIDETAGDRIFERFYQAKGKQHYSKGGFGIGLFLVKYFIDSHKGEVGYSSRKGEGTCFFIRLWKGRDHFDPSVEVHESPQSSFLPVGDEEKDLSVLVQPETDKQGDPGKLQRSSVLISDKKTMLVIDDDEEIRSYLRQLFEGEMNILEADNGAAGLSLCREYLPDIVVSDVVMPGMDGVTLCNKIKKDPELGHIPVILLTAVSSNKTKLQGVEEGADDYITKPWDNELFIARVNNILNTRTTLQHYYFDRITLKDSTQKVSAEDKYFLDKCIALVEENLDNDEFSITVMTARMGMSRSNLYRKVKAISGDSINAFIRSIRLRKAAVLLLSTDMNINQVAFQVGLNDVKYFRLQFKKVFGVNPSDYVKKYRHVFNADFQVIQGKS